MDLNSSIRPARSFFSTSPLTTPFSGYSSYPQPGGRLPAPRPSIGLSSLLLYLTFEQSTLSLSSDTLVLKHPIQPCRFLHLTATILISVVLPSQQHRPARRPPPVAFSGPRGSLSRIWLFGQLPLKFRGQPPRIGMSSRLKTALGCTRCCDSSTPVMAPTPYRTWWAVGSATADGLIHRYNTYVPGSPYLGQTQQKPKPVPGSPTQTQPAWVGAYIP
jgi:hypothetical protein